MDRDAIVRGEYVGIIGRAIAALEILAEKARGQEWSQSEIAKAAHAYAVDIQRRFDGALNTRVDGRIGFDQTAYAYRPAVEE